MTNNHRARAMVDLDQLDPDLSLLSDDEMNIVIDADLRGRLRPVIAAALRSPECVDRWYWLLGQIARSVNDQLRTRAEDHLAQRLRLRADKTLLDQKLIEAQGGTNEVTVSRLVAKTAAALDRLEADYLQARNKVLRFQSGLLAALEEARRLRGALYGEAMILSEERDRLQDEVVRLQTAIEDHRRERMALDDDSDELDDALWAVLTDAPERLPVH